MSEASPTTSEPSEQRIAELRDQARQNLAQGKAPYAGVDIFTTGELDWLFRENPWSRELFPTPGKIRADLRQARFAVTLDLSKMDLFGVDLSNAELWQVNLSQTNLSQANLSGTILRQTDLSGARLSRANLSEANLQQANLTGANLLQANLSGANLSDANMTGAGLNSANLTGAMLFHTDLSRVMLANSNLSGAVLSTANLTGTDLSYGQMDQQTRLDGVTLSTQTQLGDIAWGDVPLTRIDWTQLPRLGDEAVFAQVQGKKNRIRVAHDIARAYRGLSLALKAQGLVPVASWFRLLEQRWERRALRLEGNVGGWIFSLVLDAVSGYGEQPGRTFISYLVVIASFAGLYFGITHTLETGLSQLSWDEALVLSLTSFHGRGFFPGTLSLGDWIARLGAVEAVIGLFIELILIATFSRRFLGN